MKLCSVRDIFEKMYREPSACNLAPLQLSTQIHRKHNITRVGRMWIVLIVADGHLSVILADRSNLVLDFCQQASFLRSYFYFVISATRLRLVHVLNEWCWVMFPNKVQIQIIFLIFYNFFWFKKNFSGGSKFRALFSRRPFWLFFTKTEILKKGFTLRQFWLGDLLAKSFSYIFVFGSWILSDSVSRYSVKQHWGSKFRPLTLCKGDGVETMSEYALVKRMVVSGYYWSLTYHNFPARNTNFNTLRV